MSYLRKLEQVDRSRSRDVATDDGLIIGALPATVVAARLVSALYTDI